MKARNVKLGKMIGELNFDSLDKFKKILTSKVVEISLEKINGVVQLYPAELPKTSSKGKWKFAYILIGIPMPRETAEQVFKQMKMKLIVDKL